MAPTSTAAPGRAAHAPTVRIFVDGSGKVVLFAEAGEDAVAFLSSLLAAPVRAAVGLLLQEDPASAAAGCFGNLSAAGALLPRGAATPAAAAASSSLAPPPASPAGMGIMSRRLFRCDHLGCRCSDAVSRAAGSACPCCGRGRVMELHFLEACFFRRPDGSAASSSVRRGAGRSGDTFYRCHARDTRHGGRDLLQCRYRVTDERGVECPLCHSHTTVTVKCTKDAGEDSSTRPAGVTAPALSYAIMDELAVRPMAEEGRSRAALLSELGVADSATVREETVPFGYKEGLTILEASLRSKTVIADVFLRAAAGRAPRRR